MIKPIFRLFFAFVLFFAENTIGQNSYTYVFTNALHAPTGNLVNTVCADSSGNYYMAGKMRDSVSVNGDYTGFEMHATNTLSTSDAFIIKYNNTGQPVWWKTFGSTGEEAIVNIAYDGDKSIYLTGYFNGTVDLDPGPGVSNFTSAGSFDIFIMRLDTNGQFIWAKKIGGSNIDMPHNLVCQNSKIYFAGRFKFTADLDPGPAVMNVTSLGNSDPFISVFDTLGNLTNIQVCETIDSQDFLVSVAPDNSVYLSGTFIGNADLDPGPGTLNYFASNSAYDLFVIKMTSSLAYSFAFRIGLFSFTEYGNICAIDPSGNFYLSGLFRTTLDFDPGTGVSSLTGGYNHNGFVSKYDSSGNFLTAAVIAETVQPSAITGCKMLRDKNGYLYFYGAYRYSADFEPGPGTTLYTNGGNDDDQYITCLDSNFNFIWAKSAGSLGNELHRYGCIDNNNNLLIAGLYANGLDFDPGPGVDYIYALAGGEGYCSKYSPCSPYSYQQVSTCSSYVFNSQVLTQSGVYQQVFPDTSGCDSVSVLILTITHPDTTITVSQGQLISNAVPGSTYQWVDCNNNYQPIPNATQGTYLPLNNGNYAVIVTTNGCTDTSACYVVNSFNITSATAPEKIRCYPNPVSDYVELSGGSLNEGTVISVYNQIGMKVLTFTITNPGEARIPMNGMASGLYFICISDSDIPKSGIKIIKR